MPFEVRRRRRNARMCSCRRRRSGAGCVQDVETSLGPPAGALALRILMWNPHWQCFALEEIARHCQDGATRELQKILRQGVDFANIVELADDSYAPPKDFGMQHKNCGLDRTTLLWNSSRWRPSSVARHGCMEAPRAWRPEDRPFLVQVFEATEQEGRVIVVGAHFPHGELKTLEGADLLAEAIRAAVDESGVQDIIFAADVNLESWTTSASIMERIGVPDGGGVVSTELVKSCCKNDGFTHTYDRVMANFGASMETTLLHDPLPQFARRGIWQFHKGVIGTVLIPDIA